MNAGLPEERKRKYERGKLTCADLLSGLESSLRATRFVSPLWRSLPQLWLNQAGKQLGKRCKLLI